MIELIMFIVSIILVSIWIHFVDKYGYSDCCRDKIKVPNIGKIGLYLLCVIPFFNIIGMLFLMAAISVIEIEWKGWEEDKLLYWLFKK